MPSLNSVMVIGNCGQDPEMRFTPNGNPVTTFTVAVNRAWTDNDGAKKEETEWVNVVAWNKLAEQCNAGLNKGALCYVEGRIKTRTWESDGVKHYKTEVIANKVIFLSKKAEASDETGDIPFIPAKD